MVASIGKISSPWRCEGWDTFGGSIFARDGAGAGTSRTLTARDLLAGSAFRFTSEGCGADARWTLWGRGAWSGFSVLMAA